MADELIREVLAPERMEEMRAEELAKLRDEVEALAVEIRQREWRELARNLDEPYQAPILDQHLPLMRSRLAQRRAKLVEILSRSQTPAGEEDEGLSKDPPVNRALLAVKDVLVELVQKRALPVEDPLISDVEVEEEYERQTGDAGDGPAGRRGVRSR